MSVLPGVVGVNRPTDLRRRQSMPAVNPGPAAALNTDTPTSGTSATTITSQPQRCLHVWRRYPLHFCAFDNCCYKFDDEPPLMAKDLVHLPVCHEFCFRLEGSRLSGGDEGVRREWRLCHRECFLREVLKGRGLGEKDLGDKEIVPLNRTLKERLGWPKLVHRLEERRREKGR